VLAVPLGTILGGPLVTAIGAGETLLICALATITLGTAAAVLTFTKRRSR
jgi:predicted MFS family arabinose efflux permease